MVGNSAVQSAPLDLGNGSHNETMKQILGVVDKKVRNMEKKKVSLFHFKKKTKIVSEWSLFHLNILYSVSQIQRVDVSFHSLFVTMYSVSDPVSVK